MIQTPTKPPGPAPDEATEQIVSMNEAPVRRGRWRDPRNAIWISLILLGVLLIGVLFGPLHWAAGFQGRLASRGMMAAPVSATGFLQAPVYNLNFSSAIGGLISDINVNMGQHVVTNQVLAHLGYNTYGEQVNEAQVAIDAARVELNAARAYVDNEIAHRHFVVVLAQDTLKAELNNRQALQRQAQANIHFAQVALDQDEETLDAVMRSSDAAIRSARQTEASAIAACQAAASSSSPGGDSGPSAASSSGPENAGGSTQDACIQAAQDAFRAAVASAKQAVITAQGTVAKDRAALKQARANADVNLTDINGRIVEARDSIDVARTNPDVSNAYIALAAAEFTYRTSLATLLTDERLLALTVMHAPHPGVITAVIGTVGGVPGAVTNLVPAGGLESQGVHGGLTFIQITDTSCVNRVLTFVDETDIPKVHQGQGATFTLKAFGSHQFSGHVITMSPNGLGYPGSQTSIKYQVIVAIDGDSVGSYDLLSGMTANVSFT
ncbi:HlyD family secretion protein [Dictyobacter aurantiacus]|uniref:Membrane fusion protein biotin-lipoyl like domain-containing protein n=1 Tax=Dictyobacter aurantiacus TaxID=1936993 RepID=A0A401ZKA8_9CHLR|nr:hypothetical protein [Dictyobacter aurantiacus]GCE07268.1 hypothetical protein KDAU_45970 [Dictyobacter aurantiacus]